MSLGPIENKENSYNIYSAESDTQSKSSNPILESGLVFSLDRLIALSELAEDWANGEFGSDISINKYSTVDNVKGQMIDKKGEKKDVDSVKPDNAPPSTLDIYNVKPDNAPPSTLEGGVSEIAKDQFAYEESYRNYLDVQNSILEIETKIYEIGYSVVHSKQVEKQALKEELGKLKEKLPALEAKVNEMEAKVAETEAKYPEFSELMHKFSDLRIAEQKLDYLNKKIVLLQKNYDNALKDGVTNTKEQNALFEASDQKKTFEEKVELVKLRLARARAEEDPKIYKAIERIDNYQKDKNDVVNKTKALEELQDELKSMPDPSGFMAKPTGKEIKAYEAKKAEIAEAVKDLEAATQSLNDVKSALIEEGLLDPVT